MGIIRLTLLVILISGAAELCFGIDEYSPGVTIRKILKIYALIFTKVY